MAEWDSRAGQESGCQAAQGGAAGQVLKQHNAMSMVHQGRASGQAEEQGGAEQQGLVAGQRRAE